MMLILEGCIDLPCFDGDSHAFIRQFISDSALRIRQCMHHMRFQWFYVLSTRNGTKYLRRLKVAHSILIRQDGHRTAPKVSELSERNDLLFDAVPQGEDALELIIWVYSYDEFHVQDTFYNIFHNLKLSRVKLLDNPHSSFLVSPANERWTTSGIGLSSAASELACEIMAFHIDNIYLTLAQTLSFSLRTFQTTTFLSTLSANIKYREEYLGEDHEVVSYARAASVDLANHYGSILHKPPECSIQAHTATLNAAARKSTFAQHRNLVLPTHWLCNNLGIRFGQEILILRALMATFQTEAKA
jgi:hypothetical protein